MRLAHARQATEESIACQKKRSSAIIVESEPRLLIPPTLMTRQSVLHVASIRKTYGRTVAVDDVSFDVQRGEIFGLIGPNGAGKTTTMECMAGLRRPDRGVISVLGL